MSSWMINQTWNVFDVELYLGWQGKKIDKISRSWCARWVQSARCLIWFKFQSGGEETWGRSQVFWTSFAAKLVLRESKKLQSFSQAKKPKIEILKRKSFNRKALKPNSRFYKKIESLTSFHVKEASGLSLEEIEEFPLKQKSFFNKALKLLYFWHQKSSKLLFLLSNKKKLIHCSSFKALSKLLRAFHSKSSNL